MDVFYKIGSGAQKSAPPRTVVLTETQQILNILDLMHSELIDIKEEMTITRESIQEIEEWIREQ